MNRTYHVWTKRLLAVCLVYLLSGCGDVLQPRRLTSVRGAVEPAAGAALALHIPAIAVRPSTPIGGYAPNPKSSYTRAYRYGKQMSLDVRALYAAMRTQLESDGYRAEAITGASLWRVRPKVVSFIYNAFGSDAAKGWSEAELAVDWEVVGTSSLRLRTVGYARARSHTTEVVSSAWIQAVAHFSRSSQLVRALNIALPTREAPRNPEPQAKVFREFIAGLPASSELSHERLSAHISRSSIEVMLDGRQALGILISSDGLLVVPNTAVSHPQRALVRLSSERTIAAQVVRHAPKANVTLLQAALPGLAPAALHLQRDLLGTEIVLLSLPEAREVPHRLRRGTITSAPPGEFDTDLMTGKRSTSSAIFDRRGRLVGLTNTMLTSNRRGVQGMTIGTILEALGVTPSQRVE